MHLYLSNSNPRNCTYSDEHGQLFYKVASAQHTATLYRSLPDLHLPTAERQLWEERHFLETHPSWAEHPEWEGRGSGVPQDDVIVEERRFSSDSSYEFRSLSGAQTPRHADDHAFFTKEHWVHFADVDFHTVHSTRFNVAGTEVKASALFRKEGWTAFGRNRIFAHQGREYRWEMAQRHIRLYLHPPTQPHASLPRSPAGTDAHAADIVAEYSPGHWGAHSRRKHPPHLHIRSEHEHLADMVLATFVYVERLRSEREEPPPPAARHSTDKAHAKAAAP